MDHSKIINDIKRREALRQNEPELRSLKQKLNNDLIRKTQECQIKEKEYASLMNKFSASRENEIIKQKIEQDMKLCDSETKEQQKNKDLYGNELQLQIKLKEVSKINEVKLKKEEEKRDAKNYFDKITKEYNICLEKEKQLIKQLQYERDILRQAREVERRKNELLSLEESRRIDEINREMEERLRKQEEEQREKLREKEILSESIAKNLHEQKIAQEERERLIQEIQEYEIKLQAKKMNEGSTSKDVKAVESYKLILQKQIEANVAHENFLKDLEYQYKSQLMDEVKKQKQLDGIKQMEEKNKQIKYGNDIQQQIDENLERRKINEDLIRETNDYIKSYNAARDKQINEEKTLMIMEHNMKIPN